MQTTTETVYSLSAKKLTEKELKDLKRLLAKLRRWINANQGDWHKPEEKLTTLAAASQIARDAED